METETIGESRQDGIPCGKAKNLKFPLDNSFRMTSKNRTTVYRNLYRAYYWVLLKAKSMDKDGHIFALARLTAEDIDSVLSALRKRGHMDKEYK